MFYKEFTFSVSLKIIILQICANENIAHVLIQVGKRPEGMKEKWNGIPRNKCVWENFDYNMIYGLRYWYIFHGHIELDNITNGHNWKSCWNLFFLCVCVGISTFETKVKYVQMGCI